MSSWHNTSRGLLLVTHDPDSATYYQYENLSLVGNMGIQGSQEDNHTVLKI